MASVLHGMKKAAAVIQTTAQNTGDLGMTIYYQKKVSESWSKLALAKAEVARSMTSWSKTEPEATQHFIDHHTQLQSLFVSMCEDIVKRHDYNRRCYKEMLKGEKVLEDLMEKKHNWEGKVAKARKQLEGSRKGKQESLQLELAKTASMLQKSEEELETYQRIHAQFKYMKLAEAFKDEASTCFQLSETAMKIATAQERINSIYLCENINRFSAHKLNEASAEAQTVLTDLAEELKKSKLMNRDSARIHQGSQDEESGYGYMDSLELEIPDARMVHHFAQDRPLPPIPQQSQLSTEYDNNTGGLEYTDMEFHEYEEYNASGSLQGEADDSVYEALYRNDSRPPRPASKVKPAPRANSLAEVLGELKIEQKRYSDMQNIQNVEDNGSTDAGGQASPLQRRPTRKAPPVPANRNSTVRSFQCPQTQANNVYCLMQSPKSSVRSSCIVTSQTINDYALLQSSRNSVRSSRSATPSDYTISSVTPANDHTAMQSDSHCPQTPHEYTPMMSQRQSVLQSASRNMGNEVQATNSLYPDLQETKMAANMAETLANSCIY